MTRLPIAGELLHDPKQFCIECVGAFGVSTEGTVRLERVRSTPSPAGPSVLVKGELRDQEAELRPPMRTLIPEGQCRAERVGGWL